MATATELLLFVIARHHAHVHRPNLTLPLLVDCCLFTTAAAAAIIPATVVVSTATTIAATAAAIITDVAITATAVKD